MESKSHWSLSSEGIQKNIDTFVTWGKKAFKDQAVEAVYVSSFDIFLSEYVPRQECHRYYLTGFTGSVSEVLALTNGNILLFVDGRYHEQADKEVKFHGVEIVKVPFGVSLQSALLGKIKELKLKKIALEGDRTPYLLSLELKKLVEIMFLPVPGLFNEIGVQSFISERPIYSVSNSLTGASVTEKLNLLLQDGQGLFISALDVLAWLSNCRGHHMPYQSQFMGKGFATKEKMFIFVLKGSKITHEAQQVPGLNFVYLEHWNELSKALLPFKATLSKIFFSPRTTNLMDYKILSDIWPSSLSDDFNFVTKSQALKNKVEIQTFFDEFDKSDKAIFKTRNWLFEQIKNGTSPSEMNFFNQANAFYKEMGAVDQSFNTIAAYGAHSSIIHFGSPEDQCFLKEGELALLDSGGYYKSGYATDTTRTFCPFENPDPMAIKIYTMTLKGLLNALFAVFPSGTIGSQIDSLARMSMRQEGFDYAHGTGHGVGVNVHEGHYSVTPISQVPLVEGLIGSLEPGIYLPGFGGVRLENIVVVEKHTKFPNMLCFKTLTIVGFEENLINLELLNDQEKKWLKQYEELCAKKGRSSFSPKTLQAL